MEPQKTICGKVWLDQCVSNLTTDDQDKVSYHKLKETLEQNSISLTFIALTTTNSTRK